MTIKRALSASIHGVPGGGLRPEDAPGLPLPPTDRRRHISHCFGLPSRRAEVARSLASHLPGIVQSAGLRIHEHTPPNDWAHGLNCGEWAISSLLHARTGRRVLPHEWGGGFTDFIEQKTSASARPSPGDLVVYRRGREIVHVGILHEADERGGLKLKVRSKFGRDYQVILEHAHDEVPLMYGDRLEFRRFRGAP